MAENNSPMPVHVDDAVEYFKSCADAFACLSVLFGALQDNDDDEHTSTDALLISGLHIADRFSSLADYWRRELKAGGLVHELGKRKAAQEKQSAGIVSAAAKGGEQ